MAELIKKLYSLRHLRSPEYQTTEAIIEKGIAELEQDLADSKHWQHHWKNESSIAKQQLAELRKWQDKANEVYPVVTAHIDRLLLKQEGNG